MQKYPNVFHYIVEGVQKYPNDDISYYIRDNKNPYDNKDDKEKKKRIR